MGATNGLDGSNQKHGKGPKALALFLVMACFELLCSGALARSPITTTLLRLRSGVGAAHHSESTRYGYEQTHVSSCTGASCVSSLSESGATEVTCESNSGASKNYQPPTSGGRSDSTEQPGGRKACGQIGRKQNGALRLERLRYGLFQTNPQRRFDPIHIRLQIIIGGRQRHASEY